MTTGRRSEGALAVAPLITATAMAGTVCAVVTAQALAQTVAARPVAFATFLVVAGIFQFFSVQAHGSGGESVAAIATLAGGIALGVGPAIAIGVAAALVQWGRSRGLLHRAIFDMANFAVSAAAATGLYELLAGAGGWRPRQLAAAFGAGLLYKAVNSGLLCLAISLDEGTELPRVWRERFHWARFHYLAVGPLALASAIAYDELGLVGVVAFSAPPTLLMLSMRQYLHRTRAAVEEVRTANAGLRAANEELETKNGDLRALYEFTGGLASRIHDRAALVAYAEEFLSAVSGARARLRIGPGSGGIALTVAGRRIGTLSLIDDGGFNGPRWGRLQDALLPQLATAIDSTDLVERVRKTHLDTIAALSRSMEAKDYYTGGHTERVAEIAVSLGRRLGYSGGELDAIEIGALLHDIGKIGIPERILHKPAPLDEDEWRVMKEHPVISEYILAGIDLHPIVRQIVRSGHERIDGAGYPDGLGGAEIPLPARIVLVADALDALTSERPYRPARSLDDALAELRANTGTQFCPTVMAALEELVREEPHLFGALPLRIVRVA